MFAKPPVYDELELDLDILWDIFGENLEVSSNEKSIGLSSLSPELRLLTSSTEHINLGRAIFLHDLCNDEEIDVISHIFQILSKIVERNASRNCLPFCYLITKILKLKGVLGF